MSAAHLDPTRRHDAVLLFDVTDGNPNGDPDGGNQPRTDDETGQGLVTDVALKRKIRDTVALLRGDDPRYGIFVEAGHALNTRIEQALKANPGNPDNAQQWLCQHYFDIRMFGGVLSTGTTKGGAGKVRGPMQLTFARSLDAILPTDHAITRVTPTRPEDLAAGKVTEMGSKWTVPYGLYRAHAFFSAPRATKTGVTSDDMATLWQALTVMFDHDRAASRGEMKLCGLYIFNHPDPLGVAPAATLTSRITLYRANPDKAPRQHTDYTRSIDTTDLPTGVEFTPLVDLWP
ncbi:type I-C CRISPR-associated protein Cas7/Csd2 [Couchioplanes caeruleus]|uniref:Type I-C CRISPR-associated protein Cas7/Csd2 n=2 Tax=Couchioplanes caeruleus TaxID=56438 RepID=A0A1K0GQ25_9ACTN|nr:type I-C CRISPR-associated protein Cas7/Csd2 [Couchioplanes caeruleus]OJF14510.1 type I-C CRISPR-associated protein Cas7/Csd2 [Couchioplanes caeruleus subsp. caeruleus]ROP21221.1 CRISPR-associated Csd2 family protein [Couchioplanes caeruleus]